MHMSFIGNLKRLNGLSLSGNPLQYPPKDIVQQGTKESCIHL